MVDFFVERLDSRKRRKIDVIRLYNKLLSEGIEGRFAVPIISQTLKVNINTIRQFINEVKRDNPFALVGELPKKERLLKQAPKISLVTFYNVTKIARILHTSYEAVRDKLHSDTTLLPTEVSIRNNMHRNRIRVRGNVVLRWWKEKFLGEDDNLNQQ